jgi:rhodanese-related sulfurtransferase
MKKGIFFIVLVLLLPASVFFNSYTSIHPATIEKTLSPAQFKHRLERHHGVLVDVRTPAEYQAECIAGAININVQADDFKTRIGNLDKNKEYFLYCGIGKRSAMARGIMEEAGFKTVYDLKGGLTEWKQKGFPVTKLQL